MKKLKLIKCKKCGTSLRKIEGDFYVYVNKCPECGTNNRKEVSKIWMDHVLSDVKNKNEKVAKKRETR